MRFKPGQKIVCVKRDAWRTTKGRVITWPLPKFNEIVTVDNPDADGAESGITIKEYPTPRSVNYDERCFEPLIDDSVLKAELQSIPEIARV